MSQKSDAVLINSNAMIRIIVGKCLRNVQQYLTSNMSNIVLIMNYHGLTLACHVHPGPRAIAVLAPAPGHPFSPPRYRTLWTFVQCQTFVPIATRGTLQHGGNVTSMRTICGRHRHEAGRRVRTANFFKDKKG